MFTFYGGAMNIQEAVQDFLAKNREGRFCCTKFRIELTIQDCINRQRKNKTHQKIMMGEDSEKIEVITPMFMGCRGCNLWQDFYNPHRFQQSFNPVALKTIEHKKAIECQTKPRDRTLKSLKRSKSRGGLIIKHV